MWKMYVKRCGVTGISWIGLERGTLTRPSLRVPNVPFGLHISFYSLLQCKVAAKMWFRLLQAAKMDWLYQIALLISFPDRMQLVRERRKRSYGWQQPMQWHGRFCLKGTNRISKQGEMKSIFKRELYQPRSLLFWVKKCKQYKPVVPIQVCSSRFGLLILTRPYTVKVV